MENSAHRKILVIAKFSRYRFAQLIDALLIRHRLDDTTGVSQARDPDDIFSPITATKRNTRRQLHRSLLFQREPQLDHRAVDPSRHFCFRR